MGEGVLERASSLFRRRRVRQLHDGRRRGSHPRDVRQELRPSGEDQEALRSGEPVPRKSEHQAEMKTEFLVAELGGVRLDRPYCFHLFSSRGGCCNVCITTQYCSVFARNALNCSAVACGARTSKVTRMLSNPTGASFEIPRVPCRSRSPSTVTSMRSVGIPMAAATIWQVICAHAANAPNSKSPEHAPVPAPPTPLCACAL